MFCTTTTDFDDCQEKFAVVELEEYRLPQLHGLILELHAELSRHLVRVKRLVRWRIFLGDEVCFEGDGSDVLILVRSVHFHIHPLSSTQTCEVPLSSVEAYGPPVDFRHPLD